MSGSLGVVTTNSATDSTKAVQEAESDDDDGVESVELPTKSKVESRPNVDAILSSLNHVNPTTNPIAKSTILEDTSNFSTKVTLDKQKEAPISAQGYSNTVPEWLIDEAWSQSAAILEVNTTNFHHETHHKLDPAGALIQDVEHVDTTESPRTLLRLEACQTR